MSSVPEGERKKRKEQKNRKYLKKKPGTWKEEGKVEREKACCCGRSRSISPAGPCFSYSRKPDGILRESVDALAFSAVPDGRREKSRSSSPVE
jgi:hypothetical protein